MSDIEFISGLSFKAPRDGAPEYVKATGSIKRLDLIAWLNAKEDEWVNFDLKVSHAGKWYAAVNNWKPDKVVEKIKEVKSVISDPFPDDDIPF